LAIVISSPNIDEKDRAYSAMKCIKHVKSSYWDWFESEQYFRSRLSDIIFIGLQESLVDDFDILKLKLDLSENGELPSNDILAHRNPTNLEKALTYKAVENLKKWYNEDFKFIALCGELIRKHPFLRNP